MTPTDFPRVEAPSTTSDRPADPSPADVVARLREAATSIRDDGTPAQVGLTAEECDEAIDLITRLQARAEKAERERDEAIIRANNLVNDTVQMGMARDAAEAEAATLRKRGEMLTNARDFVARWAWREDPPNANNKLTDGDRLSAIKYHPAIRAALANKETENV